MPEKTEQHRHYELICKAIDYIEKNVQCQPALIDVANHINLSEFHFHRLFSEWAGITPKPFLQFVTRRHIKPLLLTHPILSTAESAGLSSSSRLHDVIIKWDTVTPGEFKSGGTGLTIHFHSFSSPFGYAFIATTPRGICKLAFYDTPNEHAFFYNELLKEWPNAHIASSEAATKPTIDTIFSNKTTPNESIHVLLKGSEFQLKVWEALLHLPQGKVSSYQDIAVSLNQPRSTRAVASAIAKNTIGLLIPCHRVIRSNGEVNQYRWGAVRKKILLAKECSSNLE